MGSSLRILYRGPLSSCNYDCGYCPFAKHRETKKELNYDLNCLEKFVKWIASREQQNHSVLFTPWGEALTRRWYRDAMTSLSNFKNINRVAVQTNLSCNLRWLRDANRDKIALWCTYHPLEVRREEFVKQCRELDAIGIRYSVGIVGLRENIDQAEALRLEVSNKVYVWINAYKREPGYYDDVLFSRYRAIDPHFQINSIRHPSFGKSCRTGESVVSIDGHGNVRRCHFVDKILGNIYETEIEKLLKPRNCPNATCGCHIGYVHLRELNLYPLFKDGLLERIPNEASWNRTTTGQSQLQLVSIDGKS